MRPTMSRFHRTIAPLAVLVLALALAVPSALASDPSNTKGFRKAVTLTGIREHQAAFQSIAESASAGTPTTTRASGTAGFDQSAQYVFNKLKAAGYNPAFQEFPFPFFQALSVSGSQLAPTQRDLAPIIMTYSPPTPANGITAQVTAVPADTTPGCEATDFAAFPTGNIALIRRGGCTFAIKTLNAKAAGASAALIYNNTAGPLNGTLGALSPNYAPVAGITAANGAALIADMTSGPVIVSLNIQSFAEMRVTRNVIAETPGGDPNRVIVVGAHLDSVIPGPGINDNGSGSATILEVAEVLATQQDPREVRNKLRFMWYGAEELGLLGSRHYVNQLSQTERTKIKLMLNFDMIGSPNYVRFVYDGDNSAFGVGPGAAAGPQGSGEIERVFHDYFASQGLASAETPFSGRSDYGPFIEVGIPAGGLFTGAEGVKTEAQAGIFGGTAGQAYDPCYHQACDNFANNNDQGLDEMSDAVAHAVLYFSKRNFATQPLVNPSGPVSGVTGTAGGGGLHDHDHEPEAE